MARLNLTGPQIKHVQEVFEQSFNSQELEEELLLPLDRHVANITSPSQPFPAVLLDVIESAERQGWTSDLLRQAAAVRPQVREVQGLTWDLSASGQDAVTLSQEAQLVEVDRRMAFLKRIGYFTMGATAVAILVLLGARFLGIGTTPTATPTAPRNAASTAHCQSDLEVIAYYHAEGFAQDQASQLCQEFEFAGVKCIPRRHVDPNSPDAIFIGAGVPVKWAQFALQRTPYSVKWFFRPDYPDVDSPSLPETPCRIGIGYMAAHLVDPKSPPRPAFLAPVPVTEADIARLSESGITTEEFHRRLDRILGAQ